MSKQAVGTPQETSSTRDTTSSTNAFWMVDKTLTRKLGLNAAVLLADLHSKRKYFRDRGDLCQDGSFFNTTENLERDLGIGKRARLTAQRVLERSGVLSIHKRGCPAKNYFIIRDDRINQIVAAEKAKDNTQCPTNVGDQSTLCVGDQSTLCVGTNKNKGNENRTNKPREAPKEYSSEETPGGYQTKINPPVYAEGSAPAEVKGDGRPVSKRVKAHTERIERAMSLCSYLEDDGEAHERLDQLRFEQLQHRNGLADWKLGDLEEIESKITAVIGKNRFREEASTLAEDEVSKAQDHLVSYLRELKEVRLAPLWTELEIENAYRAEQGSKQFALATRKYTLKSLLEVHNITTKQRTTVAQAGQIVSACSTPQTSPGKLQVPAQQSRIAALLKGKRLTSDPTEAVLPDWCQGVEQVA